METNLSQQKTVQVFYKIFVLFSKKYFDINGKKKLPRNYSMYVRRTYNYLYLFIGFSKYIAKNLNVKIKEHTTFNNITINFVIGFPK